MNFKSALSLASCTAGALGMVASSLVVATAPAQAQVAECPALGQFWSAFKTAPCRVGDKLFTFNSSSPAGADNGNVFISETVTPSFDVHSLTYRPQPTLTLASGTYVLEYTVEIVDDPLTGVDESLTKEFSRFSSGYTATGGFDEGILLDKTVWSGGFGTGLIGTSTASSVTSSTGTIVQVPHGIGKLFVQDTVSVSDPDGILNSLTNDFIQRPRVVVPEPSALLGLGLLGLGGLISKTRRRG
jgi:hypothetical protein